VRTVPHLYIFVSEGETRPLLCGVDGSGMPFVLEGLDNSSWAAVFECEPAHRSGHGSGPRAIEQ